MNGNLPIFTKVTYFLSGPVLEKFFQNSSTEKSRSGFISVDFHFFLSWRALRPWREIPLLIPA